MYQPDSNPRFGELEHKILDFWEEHRAFEQLRARRKDGPIFRFLDGPITANNPMGVHHAWGRTLKDVFLRYKAMQGFTAHYQNGFDSQGLWVEVEVEKELGLAGKQDIEAYGVENFIRRCKERVVKYSGIQTAQSIRLGQWMDWENSYYTNTDENIQAIWHFLQTCHRRNWLYRGDKLLPWCPRCGTSLSEHEMAGSYREMAHKAVFVRAPLVEHDADVLVWTTTPWTLPANVALAVKPDIPYAEVRLPGVDRPLILARESLGVLKEHKMQVLRVFDGAELVGLHFETFLPELPVQQGVEHRVVAWDMVAAGEGTGVVHIAPGCGAEDYELAQVEDLPVVLAVQDYGRYIEGYGWLEGRDVLTVADAIIDHLEQAGKLLQVYSHVHRYPVCWRCKTEVIFRLVDEWFIRSDELRPLLLKAAQQVHWQPEHIGKLMEDWLENMHDWNISRKRYYGLPLPFYPCPQCGTVTVVGSKAELRALAGPDVDDLPELHRPWIDRIRIACPTCGERVERVAETGDVWLDAGIVPYSTLGYFEDRERWQLYYPAEWIVEMREQVRLWFYSMLYMGVVLHNRAPYERVLCHESVVAEDGTRFSKTGFMIRFDEAVEEMGADVIRYLYASANPTKNVRFGYTLGGEVRRKLLSIWNVYSFFVTYARLDRPQVAGFEPAAASLTVTDRWLLARIGAFVREATAYMDNYEVAGLVQASESFVEDLSNWYIRVNRRRYWKSEDTSDKQTAYWCLYQALRTLTQVLSPVIPFVTEEIWQNGIRPLDEHAAESVHLTLWPAPAARPQDETLLAETAFVRGVISLALRLRNQVGIKVRQPLETLFIAVASRRRGALQAMMDLVIDEVNVKQVRFLDDRAPLEEQYLSLDFSQAGPFLQKDAGKVKQLLTTLDAAAMQRAVAQVQAGEDVVLPGWEQILPPRLFSLEARPRQHIAIEMEGDLTVALDTTLTDELVLEGVARDLVRQVQVVRKESGLDVDDRIHLRIEADAGVLQRAMAAHEAYISQETLAVSFNNGLSHPLASKDVEVADHKVRISIARV